MSAYATAEAFERLYHELAPKLVKYLVFTGSEMETAKDLAQETFARLWKRRETLSDDPSQVSGLTYAVARNLRTDGWRKSSREIPVEEVPEVATGPTGSPSDAVYLRNRLTTAFDALPPLLRETYVLYQVMELPIREIAVRTNTTEANVKVRIFRAKEKLRPLLSDLM